VCSRSRPVSAAAGSSSIEDAEHIGRILKHRAQRGDDDIRGTPLAPSTAIADIDLTSCFDYRWCAFAPRAHQGYRVDMNTRAGLG
jgi:hypothetical protein